MTLAADRDRIAFQYAHVHVNVFELGLPAFEDTRRRALAAGDHLALAAQRAMQRAYLEFVAAFPDSHIVRKHGVALAHSVMRSAQPWLARALAGEPLDADPAFAAWDLDLKAAGLNPGTSADLTVAALFAAGLLSGGAAPR